MIIPDEIHLHWINRLGIITRKRLAADFQEHGFEISAEEWAVLILLWNDDGQMPSVLADRTIRDRTTMTRMIDTMVRKGLVVRENDAKDRRKSLIMMSAKTRGEFGELAIIAQRLIDESKAGINTEDLNTTLRVLTAMTGNLLD